MAVALRISSQAARTAGLLRAPTPRRLPTLVFRRQSSQLSSASAGNTRAGHQPTGGPTAFTLRGSPFRVTLESNRIEFVEDSGPTVKDDDRVVSSKSPRDHSLPLQWLRDNCRCARCVNQDTMQRNFKVTDLPTVQALSVNASEAGLGVVWAHERHESFYDRSFLERYLFVGRRPYPDPRTRNLWGSDIAKNPPTVDYQAVMDGASTKGLAAVTDLIMKHGFVFVDNTPSDDAGHTKTLLERIGPIRETHYGGFYDFVPDMAKADTAYTNIALPAHTDTTYFTDPAGLQAFHMLSHTAHAGAADGLEQPAGGESLLVDGFHAVQILQKEDREAFDVLCQFAVPWHASGNEGVTITSDHMFPVIELLDSLDQRSEMTTVLKSSTPFRIRWNNDDRGVIPLFQPLGDNHGIREDKLGRQKLTSEEWYRAAAKWDEIVRRSTSEFWFQLKPGRTLIFDNYRVMHGRSAFTGLRRICGAYINRDDFVSRWRNTNLSREEVLAQVIG